MFYIPILGAFLDTGGTVIYKILANRKDVTHRDFLVYGFGSIVMVSLPFLFFFWEIDKLAGRNMNMAILAAIVFFSIVANYLSFLAYKHNDLAKIQSIRLTLPMFTILLAFIFSFFFENYADERNYHILFFALIASVTLVVSNIRRHHFYLDKYSWAMLISSFLFALELTLTKSIIEFYNPVAFYFIRCLFIFVVSFSVFRDNINDIAPFDKGLFLISALFIVGYRALVYYGYATLGVVFTTTLLILSPVLIYICSWLFLKEKVTRRQVISSMVIVGCVVGAIWLGN